MSLTDRLRALWNSHKTEAMNAAYDDFLARLNAADVASQARTAGDQMPPFLLPNAEGKLIDSDELLARGPLIVTFFRGGWCPYCAMTLEVLEAALPAIDAAGATLVALTPETGGRALEAKRERTLHYEVLCDVDFAVAMQFGVVFKAPSMYRALLARCGIDLIKRSGNRGGFLPLPATFLTGTDGIIHRAWVHIDFMQRADPDEILAALRDL
jgi:peroxiredoxin